MSAVDNLSRFKALFHGNTRSFGRLNLKTNSAVTEKGAPTDEDYQAHLDNVRGLGIVPIDDRDECAFAAIDVDCHGADKDCDLIGLANEFSSRKLPAIVCRSRSGGAHVFVFFSSPVKARAARKLVTKWVQDYDIIKYAIGPSPAIEIFSKQDILVRDDSGEKALGNWLNMPYAGSDDTNRYAIIGGKRAPLDMFLSAAESNRISPQQVLDYLNGDHAEAPPCIQSMLLNGVEAGSRNLAMYSIIVYLKKAFPEDFRDKAFEINQHNLDKPLPYPELKKIIGSAGRRDYKYKCSEEPCKSLCDRTTCIKRQYGITKSEFKDLENEDRLPEITEMIRYDTDPVKWGIMIEGKLINNVTTDELYDANRMRMRISETLRIPLPMLTNNFWYTKVIEPLMPNASMEAAPDDASMSGVIWARLREFTKKADSRKDGNDIEAKKLIFNGNPVVHTTQGGDKLIIFRSMDFVQYLKRVKSEELRGTQLWFALKGHGVNHTKVRIGKQTVNVWSVPFEEEDEKPETPSFEMEY